MKILYYESVNGTTSAALLYDPLIQIAAHFPLQEHYGINDISKDI